VEVVQLAELLGNLSSAALLAAALIGLIKGWLVLPRELTFRDKIIEELKKERAEFQQAAYSALKIGERVSHVIEERREQ
jgi:hypothetical protein